MDIKALILHAGQDTYTTTMITVKMQESVFPKPICAFRCSGEATAHL